MDTKVIGVALISLIVGAGGTFIAVRDTNEIPKGNSHMMPGGQMVDDESMGSMHGAMGDMMAELSGKTGDEFDKAFLAEMIVHHEGAVDMASAALKDAKHNELKQMANAIISAQMTEIQQMKDWQKSWYDVQ